jgi:hypothetical protein
MAGANLPLVGWLGKKRQPMNHVPAGRVSFIRVPRPQDYLPLIFTLHPFKKTAFK